VSETFLYPQVAVRYWPIAGTEGNVPIRKKQVILRDSRVFEHLEIKSITESLSSTESPNVILVKWRPPGRAQNRRVMERISQIDCRVREPVSFGDVTGAFHPSASSLMGLINARSSRRGKEQMRSKTSTEAQIMLSDLTVGDSP